MAAKRAPALLSLFLLLLFVPAAAQAPSARSVLDRWAAALGGREKLQALRAIYTKSRIEMGGMSGTVETWETSHGKRREQLRLGSLMNQDTIFDGHEGWQLTQGKLRALAGPDLEEQVTDAYLASYSQFFDGRRAGRVEFAGEKDDAWMLRILPQGGRAVTEYIDKKSGLPVKEVEREADREQVTSFQSYRAVGGVKIPSAIRVVTGGDEKYAVQVTLEDARLDTPMETALFAKPPEPAPDVHFPAGTTSVTLPFEFSGHNIWVEASINGSAPQWFILDTGAEMSVLNTPRAGLLGLKPQGSLEGTGGGAKSIDVGLIKDVRLALGGTQLDARPIMSADLSMIEGFTGRPITGILGYDVLSSYVFEIDYAARRLTLHDPRAFNPAGTGEAVPFVFHGQTPAVTASVALPGGASIKGQFMLDTGSGAAVDLNAPFVRQHQLIAKLGSAARPTFAMGVGGDSSAVMGRLASVTFGPYELKRPVARLSKDTRGSNANPDMAGSLGGQVFSRFTMTFDYAHQMLYLKPNASLNRPFERDMSGLVLQAEGKDFRTYRVYKVLDGSPAAAIGIRPGDILLRFEGKPAADFSFDALAKLFEQPGKSYRMEIKRDEKVIPLVLTTKRMV
jgi:Aspartyl protease/PDZ domain